MLDSLAPLLVGFPLLVVVWIAALRVRSLEDKVEGLSVDLENAVETAFKRGAVDWARLNYPKIYAKLTDQ